MYQITFTHAFKKQSKKLLLRALVQKKFLEITEYLVAGELLPHIYKDHQLK